jgi:hypothetical protein
MDAERDGELTPEGTRDALAGLGGVVLRAEALAETPGVYRCLTCRRFLRRDAGEPLEPCDGHLSRWVFWKAARPTA